MGPVNSNVRTSNFLLFRATMLLLMVVQATLCRSQTPPPQAHPPYQAIFAVPRVQVPDVRGRRLEDADALLRKAGLTPGRTSSAVGPRIAGTVSQQDPAPNAVVVRGTTFNLVLVAPRPSATNDGDQEFSTQVPRLDGLTPNQASALLERNRLLLGSVSTGKGKGPDGTIYGQKPQPGSWARVGSKIDVAIVEPTQAAPSADVIWVIVPNMIGQPQKVAEKMLQENHLALGGVSSGVASVPAGTVFGQRPLPNAKAIEGSRVELQIAQPPPPQRTTVRVPDLLHQDVETARTLLAQTGLQLGQVTSEEGGDPANSILAQSPFAGTEVERGSSVDVKTAQPVPTVSVPNIAQHDEAEAIAALQGVGLRLGIVDEMESAAAIGIVLSQQPVAGARVLKGTAVDVTLSRQLVTQVKLLMDPTNPAKGGNVSFHAHLEPPEKGMQYRFFFGDNTDSGWLPSAKTTHTYQQAGDFQVWATATRGSTTITSEVVTVVIQTRPFPWGLTGALGAGLLVLGGAGIYYQRWMHFHRWIRVAPNMDVGLQTVSVNSRAGSSPPVRIRVIHDPGRSTIQVKAAIKKER
jgi:beta-lactam-binding protein with PASTA domain